MKPYRKSRKLLRQKLPAWLQLWLKPDVIREMRMKFIATAMGILIIIFIVMLGLINMIMKTVSQSQSMRLLKEIANSDRYDRLSDELEPEPDFMPGKPAEDIPPPELQESIMPMVWIPENAMQDRNPDRKPWNDNFPVYPDYQDDSGYRDYPDDRHGRDPGGMPPERDVPETPDLPVPDAGGDYPDNPESQNHSDSQNTIPAASAEPAVPDVPAAVLTVPDNPVIPDAAEMDIPENPGNPDNPMPEEPGEEMLVSEPEETEPESEMTTESGSETTTTMTDSTEEIGTESIPETSVTQIPPEPPENKSRKDNFRLEMRPDKWKVDITLDHFALMADTDGNFLSMRNTENYTQEQAEAILAAILQTGKQEGMYNWLQYYRTQKAYGTLLVITEKSSDQALLNNLFRTTVIIGILALLILLVFLIFFSRWITKPVQVALERQKQFVSDASHELKTPIAVLTANADILHDEIGENKWLGYMQEQTDRMNQLVGDLLRLARMDNPKQKYNFSEFDLSRAVEATVLPFESQAFELQKNLEMDIQPDIVYYGSEPHIRQLVAIFVDNAMKYSNSNGIIKITLLQRGDDRILEFYNTGCEISQEETEKIFERFYRGDKARNNKGKSGYGLGLAIAKSIMEIHKIRMQVTCEQGAWIRFFLIL